MLLFASLSSLSFAVSCSSSLLVQGVATFLVQSTSLVGLDLRAEGGQVCHEGVDLRHFAIVQSFPLPKVLLSLLVPLAHSVGQPAVKKKREEEGGMRVRIGGSGE